MRIFRHFFKRPDCTIKRNYQLSSSIIISLNAKNINDSCFSRQIKHKKPIDNVDYLVLMMKRNKSTNFGGQYSFPGGKIDEIDFKLDGWKNEISLIDCDLNDYSILIPENFQFLDPKSFLPPHVGFKLSAIRELLEECNLLLVPSDSSSMYCDALVVNNDETKKSLYSLYKKYNKRPPLERLYPWSNWLSPDHLEYKFRTLFYYIGINSILDNFSKWEVYGEAENVTLACPLNHLSKKLDRESIYPPPQMYELQRLVNYQKMQELTIFSIQRIELGLDLYYPKLTKCPKTGATVYLLNGDENYEKGFIEGDESFDEDWSLINRLVKTDYDPLPGLWWTSNISLNGHSVPVCREDIIHSYRDFIINSK